MSRYDASDRVYTVNASVDYDVRVPARAPSTRGPRTEIIKTRVIGSSANNLG